MGLIYDSFIPGETMIEKNKLLDSDHQLMKISEMRSNTGNLPLNVLVDDCNGVDRKQLNVTQHQFTIVNDNKRDQKKNQHLIRKWNEKKTQTVVTKSDTVNHTFNLTVDEKSDLKEATMDPNINDLNKQCENLSLNKDSKEEECSSQMKSSEFKEIYKEEDLKILSDLLNVLKKHKAQLDCLEKDEFDVETQTDSNEIVLRSRGHIKKNANKSRSTPFDRSNKERSAPPQRLPLTAEPNHTLTTNSGNKAHVYVQNDNFMEGVQEEDSLFSKFYNDQVILQALSNQNLIDQIIEDLESELNKTEVQYMADNIDSQATHSGIPLNVNCGSQQNILIDPYVSETFTIQDQMANMTTSSPLHQSFVPYSPQHGDSNTGPVFSLNSFSSQSPQQSHLTNSPQQNGPFVSSNPLNSLSPVKTFINCSPKHSDTSADSMIALNPLNRSSPQQIFNNQTPLLSNVASQPATPSQQTFLNLSPQRSNIISKPTVLQSPQASTSPILYSSQNSPSSSQFFVNYAQPKSETVIQPKVSPVSQHSPYSSPYTQMTISPNTSPCQNETSDSCYETGSPSSSSAVTSPGSPYLRSSISSESDQELTAAEPHFVKSTNLINDQTARFIHKTTHPSRPSSNKAEQVLKPLGKIIQCSTKSAEQVLEDLSKSAPWKGHYIVQLVRVAISTKKNPNDCVEGFRENLMKTINTQMDKKHEKVWQLAIYVHLEFLKAPARVKEYKNALLRANEKEPSLLYIAAVERNCPLIARYISEIMYRVGFNPGEADATGNNILHTLACLGDTHAQVLAELLAATDAQSKKKIFNAQIKNKEGKTLLHIAAASPQPQITTIVLLTNNGADPLLQDKFGRTPLQYHLMAMVGRMEGSRCQPMDIEVAKKLLSPSSIECRKALDKLTSDPSTPNILLNFIETLKRERR